MLEEHCEFLSPYDAYVLLAVSRKKDTPHITNSQEIVFREVIKNENDIKRKHLKIKAMCESYRDEEGKSYPFYLYVSLNARDSLKATFALMGKINLWMEETMRGVDRSQFFKKVYGHFYSTLMYKTSKSKHTKYFMFDFDIQDEDALKSFITLLEKHTEVSMIIKTKNGYHIKVKPFNAEEIRATLEEQKEIIGLKRDANLFVEYIPNDKIPADELRCKVIKDNGERCKAYALGTRDICEAHHLAQCNGKKLKLINKMEVNKW